MVSSDTDRLLDFVGWQILGELQENGRISYSELGRRVGLSTPAVAERVRRMEEAGIISGYRAVVNPASVGLSLTAIIQVSPDGGRYDRTISLVKSLPEVLTCDRVTGTDAIIMKVALSSIAHLEALVDKLMPYGDVSASVVLSSVVEHRVLGPPPALEAADEPSISRAPTPMRPSRSR
jgi:Lrp/AsnC family transcriptional regulator, leucine-responsive regulatory protein